MIYLRIYRTSDAEASHKTLILTVKKKNEHDALKGAIFFIELKKKLLLCLVTQGSFLTGEATL